jgi:adenylate cyclase
VGQEIERKFLVANDTWRTHAVGKHYRQGYLPTQNGITVRVRVVEDMGYLTIKGPTIGITRTEYEYEIPVADAEQMLCDLCEHPLIEKIRHTLNVNDLTWEIDEFSGDNQGLILAEVELKDTHQPIQLPSWAGQEVSDDPRYFNAYLAKYPFCRWGDGGFA